MNKKSTGLLLSILGVLSLVLITAGVTYAFFSYAKEGLTENTISTGTITFVYNEVQANGAGIEITDAVPMSDTLGKAQTGTGKVFDFNVKSTVKGNAEIPYVVTARKKAGSTLANDQVKLYLTATETGAEEAGVNYTVKDDGVVALFSELLAPTADEVDLPDTVDERVMYRGIVPDGENTDYTGTFALRMWIKGAETDGTGAEADYSALEFKNVNNGTLITSTAYYAMDATGRQDYVRIKYVAIDSSITGNDRGLTAEEYAELDTETQAKYKAGEQYYPLNEQTFTVTVNVYANAAVVNAGSSSN